MLKNGFVMRFFGCAQRGVGVVGAERSIQAELQTHMYENRSCRTGFSYLILVVKQ